MYQRYWCWHIFPNSFWFVVFDTFFVSRYVCIWYMYHWYSPNTACVGTVTGSPANQTTMVTSKLVLKCLPLIPGNGMMLSVLMNFCPYANMRRKCHMASTEADTTVRVMTCLTTLLILNSDTVSKSINQSIKNVRIKAPSQQVRRTKAIEIKS